MQFSVSQIQCFVLHGNDGFVSRINLLGTFFITVSLGACLCFESNLTFLEVSLFYWRFLFFLEASLFFFLEATTVSFLEE